MCSDSGLRGHPQTGVWQADQDEAHHEDDPECAGRGLCQSQLPHLGVHAPHGARYSTQQARGILLH